jgi:putative inorganic carbon (HCO3(-)) transporter
LRTASTLGNYNNLGVFTIITFFPSITLMLGEKKWRNKLFYGLLSAMSFANLLVSFSRNALLGLIAGFLLLIMFYSYKFIIAFIISLGLALFIPVTRMRIFQIADMSQNESRLKIWKTAIYMIQDHFLLGVGNGNFYSEYGIYVKKHPELVDTYDLTQVLHPHNIFLKIQSELGILGSLAFIGILFSNFRDLIKFIKSEKNPFLYLFYKGMIISFVVFMLMNLIDNFFSAPQVVAFFWIFTAIYQSVEYNRKSSELKS